MQANGYLNGKRFQIDGVGLVWEIICERYIRLAYRWLRKTAQNSLILGRGIYILKQTNYERCFVKIVDSFA